MKVEKAELEDVEEVGTQAKPMPKEGYAESQALPVDTIVLTLTVESVQAINNKLNQLMEVGKMGGVTNDPVALIEVIANIYNQELKNV